VLGPRRIDPHVEPPIRARGHVWDGRATGVWSTGAGDTIIWWFTGSGGYAGLTAFEVVTGSDPTWTINGQIYPGSVPTP
jgi:hypothetical protein